MILYYSSILRVLVRLRELVWHFIILTLFPGYQEYHLQRDLV